jgi:hypothetical protein
MNDVPLQALTNHDVVGRCRRDSVHVVGPRHAPELHVSGTDEYDTDTT